LVAMSVGLRTETVLLLADDPVGASPTTQGR
jgi:hypothetical protein